MIKATLAGLIYFSMIFAVGFMLGIVRTLVLAPNVGESVAVAIELPIILTIGWFACLWIVEHRSIPVNFAVRAVMGGSALLFLLTAETILSLTLANRSLKEHLMLYSSLPALLGLMGQVVFALFPVIQTSVTIKQPE
jgi:hypothetical protein